MPYIPTLPYRLCPNLGKCPQLFHPAMLSTSDKACYVPHGAETGAPDGHNACILCEAAQGVRCARAGRRSGEPWLPRPLSDN
jgi:hypothetical protein